MVILHQAAFYTSVILLLTQATRYRPYETPYEFFGQVKSVRIEKPSGEKAPRVPEKQFTFSSEGKLFEAIAFKPDGSPLSKRMITYNRRGEIDKCVVEGGSTNYYIKELYDFQNNKVVIRRLDRDGNVDSTEEYVYDLPARTIIQTTFGKPSGKVFPEILGQITYKYDARGLLVEKITDKSPFDDLGKRLYKYGEKGFLERELILNSEGSMIGRWEYYHDDRGNMTEARHADADDQLLERQKYVYEFDSVGNWVKRTDWAGSITYRTITYYP